MRQEFWRQLHELMRTNENVWCLVGDLGYGGADQIRIDFPERFINCGASEFTMVGIAAGLALEGKIPFCYTITSFYYRAFEMIRTYIAHEQIPVILVGSGRDQEYEHDGYSHNAEDIHRIFDTIEIEQIYPVSKGAVKRIMTMIGGEENRKPIFLSLSKAV